MVKITFNAQKREKAGKGAARACRREGRIPAVIYGGKQEPVMISLHPVELEKALNVAGFFKVKNVFDCRFGESGSGICGNPAQCRFYGCGCYCRNLSLRGF